MEPIKDAVQSDAVPDASWFWTPRTLDEIMANAKPFDAKSESFEIEDLTEEEWAAFEAALAE